MRFSALHTALLLALLLIVGAACDGAGDANPLEIDPASIFLSEGESIALDDGALTLTYTQFLGDNRCPVDAVCITGGAAVLTAQLTRTSDGAQVSDTLAVGDVSFASYPPITGFGYRIELHDVLPVPTVDQPSPDDTRAVFFPVAD